MQSLGDKQNNFFGSNRNFYSGLSLSSGAAFAWVDFSGSAWGFGTHGNTESNRVLIAASGATIQVSYDSTTVHGDVFKGESFQMDGVNKSGLWVRTNTADTGARIWAW